MHPTSAAVVTRLAKDVRVARVLRRASARRPYLWRMLRDGCKKAHRRATGDQKTLDDQKSRCEDGEGCSARGTRMPSTTRTLPLFNGGCRCVVRLESEFEGDADQLGVVDAETHLVWWSTRCGHLRRSDPHPTQGGAAAHPGALRPVGAHVHRRAQPHRATPRPVRAHPKAPFLMTMIATHGAHPRRRSRTRCASAAATRRTCRTCSTTTSTAG